MLSEEKVPEVEALTMYCVCDLFCDRNLRKKESRLANNISSEHVCHSLHQHNTSTALKTHIILPLAEKPLHCDGCPSATCFSHSTSATTL